MVVSTGFAMRVLQRPVMVCGGAWEMGVRDRLFIWMQYVLPQHLLSRWVGRLASSRVRWVKNLFIRWFAGRYQIDMSEAVEADPLTYESFNAFFTRALKPGARPLAPGARAVLCPADGAVNQAGDIRAGKLLQAKGKEFSLRALLGGDEGLAARFEGGSFVTVYLSPRDYHRVHMPLEGTLQEMVYVPGQLFSVNQLTAENVDGLFARNERAVCVFETPAGPMALVLVGAMIVAGVETVWAGQVAPAGSRLMRQVYDQQHASICLGRGAEMGRFRLGSTVVAVFGPDMVRLRNGLAAGDVVRMGESLGEVVSRPAAPAAEGVH